MNDLNPSISVIMSVFGYKELVSGSIESILQQTFKKFVFIIIDDGCDYDLEQIIRTFKDSRIIYLKNEENIGLTRSLNRGLKLSKTEYIVRQDAGNISVPERIEKQQCFLENNPEYFLVGSSAILIDEEGNELCRETTEVDFNKISHKLGSHNCIYHSSIMFRNDRNYYYRDKFKYSQDYDLYLRLLSDGIKITNLPDFLIKERLLQNSITYYSREQQQFFKDVALKFYFERLATGKDSYSDFENKKMSPEAKNQKNSKSDKKFFFRQKAYLLLYCFKFSELRETIKKYHNENKLDLKLIYYFCLSYLPPVVNFIKTKKGIKIS
jgi:glycosyltransferase involved in cell wall biosynthesis